MDYNSNLVRILFYVPWAIEVVIGCVLVRRRLYRQLTWFTIYIGHHVFGTLIIYPIYESGDKVLYFYSRWSSDGISLTLAFMVILEIFRISLAEYPTVRRIGIRLLVIAALLSIVVALLLLPQGAKSATAMMKFIFVTERSLRIIQIALLVAMFAFSSYLALSWKNYVFGIALGYGLYAAANLAISAYGAYMGPGVAYRCSLLDSAAWSCGAAIWLVYLLQPEPKSPGLPPPSTKQDLEDWRNALTDLNRAGMPGKLKQG
jgi:hypothetical protein